MSARLRDPVSAQTHLAGAVLSVAGLVLLVVAAARQATSWQIVSFAIYGGSLVLLYTASTLYHALRLSPKGTSILRRVDHMMIFVLIAGTYTPIAAIALQGAWRWVMLIVVWSLAAAGIALKAAWLKAPRWLSTSLYLGLGWLAVVAIKPLTLALPAIGVGWLAIGGLFYTSGAVIYGLKRPTFSPAFGFHELFHLLVLAGSLSHFWLVYHYLMVR